MDKIDIKILSCLMKNARANASEIADKVNLSVSAIIERIKKLENSGTIQGYTARINPLSVGKEITAVVFVSIDRPMYYEKFVDQCKSNPNVLECFLITGEYDYLLKVMTSNMQELEKVLSELKSNEGVSKIKTNMVVAKPKEELNVSLDEIIL